MSKAEFKAEGLDMLRRYLLGDQGHERRADLARRLGVDRATVGRWIESLEAMGYVVAEDDQRRLYIDRKRYFTHLSLARDESVVMMLALRLLQQYLDKPNQHAVEVLHKLGVAFQQGLAPEVGKYVQAMAHQQRQLLELHEASLDHQKTLERVGEAWIDSRKLQLCYQPLRARRAFDDVFHPYMLEPSAIGRSTYMIGFSEQANDLRIYKLERILARPLVLDETFTASQDFDMTVLLAGAWGIWFDKDEQPTTVELRFSPEVVRRVTETRWHPSEHKQQDAEGYLLWSAAIDEPQEMLPWIRGWGANCEVLGPQALRRDQEREVLRLAQRYNITMAPLPNEDDEDYDDAVLNALARS